VSEFPGTLKQKRMKAFYIPKLGLSGLTSTALVEKGRNHVQDCMANANVTLPAGFLASLTDACDALEVANLAVLNNGGRLDTLVRNERKRDVEDLVRKLAGYVQAQCEDDQEKIASTGFETRKIPSPVGVWTRQRTCAPNAASWWVTWTCGGTVCRVA
jgi:hypothetical protein